MTIAWTRTIALGLLLWPLGCIISVDDNHDPDDGFAGDGGTSSGGSSGRGGSSAEAGSAGDSAEAGSGGSGGSEIAVTCEPEAGDDADECVRCLKQSCCDAWLGCNDESCADEFLGVRECVASEELADSDTLGMCISESSAEMDGLVQVNTQDLIDCAITPAGDAGVETLCSSECFGTDILFY